MRKTILFFFSFACTILMYGQREIKMTGVDGIKPEVLNRIITDSQRKIRTQTNLLRTDRPINTEGTNVFHRDIDTGDDLPQSSGGRVVVHRTNSPSGRPALTPYHLPYKEGDYVTKIEEKKTPTGYNEYSVLLVIYFNENLDMTYIEVDQPINNYDVDRKYLSVHLLTEKN